MADIEYQVAFEGLKEFQKILKALPDDVKDELRRTNKQLAEIVAAEARRRANTRPGVEKRTYGIAQSIKTGNVLREPIIRVGGHKKRGGKGDAKVQEFGGRAPLFGNRNKWFTVRPKQQGGAFLYPAVKAKRDVIQDGYLDALEKAIRRAG